jgi:FkbM family methyltransferase
MADGPLGKVKMIKKINFKIKENFIKEKFLNYCFNIIVNNNKRNSCFLKPNDMISRQKIISGYHEYHIKKLIDFFVEKYKLSHYFIDIGANIGLTSCQNGSLFDEVHMYEPNPLARGVLEVNAKISLNKECVKIYDFGIGVENSEPELFIPKNNWGGAFIVDQSNKYSDSVLAEKDGFKSIDKENYIHTKVKIVRAHDEFKRLFAELKKNKHTQGVIKIDVEGCEEVILEALIPLIPKDFELLIVFESWDPRFDMNKYIKLAENRNIFAFKLNKALPWSKGFKIIKIIQLLLRRDIEYSLIPQEQVHIWTGDLCIVVNKV